jgi:hypothetical protein
MGNEDENAHSSMPYYRKEKAWQGTEDRLIMPSHMDPGALSPFLQSGRPGRAGRLQPPNLNHDQLLGSNRTL